jgi:uncharacterized protein
MEISQSTMEELRSWRKEQNDYLKRDIKRLIPEHKGGEIKELSFFPPDPEYRFREKLHRYDRPELVTMTDAKGKRTVKYLKIGFFEPILNGKRFRIHAYLPAEKDEGDEDNEKMFIPFRDLTSGKESYESARYLQIEQKPSGEEEYYLDFNFAYNPNCAYSDAWACMLPPRENWLDVEIRAGEKKYNH